MRADDMTEPIEGAELVESPTLRSRHLDRTDVLEKVGELATLPAASLSTYEQVSDFYGVPVNTVRSVVEDNRVELESNGYRTLTGPELKPFKGSSYVGLRARSLAVFSRTAVLNVGMLLKDSETARLVRRYLLAVEATATVEHKATALDIVRIQERMDYRNILNALMKGGADSEDYAFIQNMFYLGLFGKTAAQIKRTQPQQAGKPRKDGRGFLKSTAAKDYLTEVQLRLLNNAVLITIGQIGVRFPSGKTSVADMSALAHESIDLVKRSAAIAGGAA